MMVRLFIRKMICMVINREALSYCRHNLTMRKPFSRGYAIASKDNKYGLLKLYPGYFQCRSSVGSLKSVDAGMESVDYVVTVPQAWQEAELELFCSNDRGEKVNLSQPGNAKSTRIFSLVLPKKRDS